MYRCVATSIEGFVQQLAVGYVAHGYWFYVSGWIPEDKDPRKTDAKLIERYGVAVSKWTRCRNKKAGLASVQYLRHGRSFVLLATHGQHPFFVQEPGFRDIREKPVEFAGCSESPWRLFEKTRPRRRCNREACRVGGMVAAVPQTDSSGGKVAKGS